MLIVNILFSAATAMLVLYWNRTLIGWHAILLGCALTATFRVMVFAGQTPSAQSPDFGLWEATQFYLVGIPIFGALHVVLGAGIIAYVQFRVGDQGFRLFSTRLTPPR